jgi:hypothetical protein
LILNIFLCYGGLGNFCHDVSAQENSKRSCHSMKVMENEQIPANSDSNKYSISSLGSSESMCQYFIVSNALEIDSDFSSDIYILNQSFSEQNNYKYILDKFSLKIPDKGSSPKLFLKNSSFLI